MIVEDWFPESVKLIQAWKFSIEISQKYVLRASKHTVKPDRNRLIFNSLLFIFKLSIYLFPQSRWCCISWLHRIRFILQYFYLILNFTQHFRIWIHLRNNDFLELLVNHVVLLQDWCVCKIVDYLNYENLEFVWFYYFFASGSFKQLISKLHISSIIEIKRQRLCFWPLNSHKLLFFLLSFQKVIE